MANKEHSTEPAKVSAPKSAGRKFKVSRVEVEEAANGGFVSHHHFKTADNKRGEMGAYREPETHVHADAETMQADVAKAFGHAPANVQEEDENA